MNVSDSSETPPILNNLPERFDLFVNREAEIDAVIKALLVERIPVVEIVGMAGIGKTSLALEIGHRLLDMSEFSGGIIWLPARLLQPSDSLMDAIQDVLETSRTEAQAYLGSQRCLIVVDGLDELGEDRRLAMGRSLHDLPSPSQVLITSRFVLYLPFSSVVKVSPLGEREAVELFAYMAKRQGEVSNAELQEATEIARAFGYHPLALTLAARLVRGDFAEARKLFEQTLDAAGELANKQERAALLHALASVAQAQGSYSEARQLYEQSLEIEEQLGDLQGKSATLNNLAEIYFTQGNLDRALALYQESLAIQEQLGDLRGKSATLNNLAQVLYAQGDLDGASALYQESLAIKEQLGDLRGKSATLNNLAQVLYARGDLDGAADLYQESLALQEQLGDVHGKATTLNNLAQIYSARDDLDGALALYQESLAIKEQVGDLRGKSATLNNLAQVLYVRGDLDGAADLYQESLALQEQLGDVHGKATTLSNLALIYFARGDLDGALPLLQESLALREQLGDVRGKAKTLNNLAQIYTARDDLDGALALYQESLSILEQLDDLQGKSAVLNDMARACSSSGDLERAFRFYQESLDVLKRIDLENQAMRTRAILAQIGYKLGRQYVEQGRWYDALSLFEKSLSVYRQGDDLDMRADVIYQIARTHHLLGNLDKARTHYRDAARLYAHTQNQLGVATCRTGLGRLMIQMGFVNDAIRALESARQIYEKLGEKKRVDEVKDVLRVAYRVKEKNGL